MGLLTCFWVCTLGYKSHWGHVREALNNWETAILGTLSHLVKHHLIRSGRFLEMALSLARPSSKWVAVGQLGVVHPVLFLAAVATYIPRKPSRSGSLRSFVLNTSAIIRDHGNEAGCQKISITGDPNCLCSDYSNNGKSPHVIYIDCSDSPWFSHSNVERPFRSGTSQCSAIFPGLWRAIPPGECWWTTQKGGPGYSGDMMGYHPPPLKMYGEGAFPPPPSETGIYCMNFFG